MNRIQEKILYDLKLIYSKHEILKQVKSSFNIFSLLVNIYDEVNLHSKMIYGILTEEKYGNTFLLSLINIIGIPIPPDTSSQDITFLNIEREKNTKLGRIDIFISFQINNDNYNIVIENKIWAKDQPKQMVRYIEFLKNYHKSKNYVFYLTLDGHEPSEESCVDLEKIHLISYQSHILMWINSCIKISSREASIREVLIQYEDIIEKIIGKDSDYIMEIKDFILQDSENFNFISSLEPAINEAKVDLQLKFWKKLEKNLDRHLKDNYGIEFKKIIKDESLGEINPWYTEDIVRKFYNTSRGNSNYGLMYKMMDIEEIGNLFLKVEISRYSLYFGIRKKVIPINDISKIYRNLETKLSNNGYDTNDERWLGWKYLYINDEIISMTNIDSELAKVLMDDEKIDVFIGSCVSQIDELIRLIYKDEL